MVATLSYGCTNSENAGGTDTAASDTEVMAKSTATEEENDSQHPMDQDTDMSAEKTEESTVSAQNQLGSEQSILALLQQNESLSTFVELIRAADMVVTLESPAPYTVFAPTNEAFAALPQGTIETLKAPGNKMELTRIIQAHVLPNRITSEEMQHNMPMKTAMGEEVIVKKNDDTIMVGGAKVLLKDVQASNGVVHVVDKLLIPPK